MAHVANFFQKLSTHSSTHTGKAGTMQRFDVFFCSQLSFDSTTIFLCMVTENLMFVVLRLNRWGVSSSKLVFWCESSVSTFASTFASTPTTFTSNYIINIVGVDANIDAWNSVNTHRFDVWRFCESSRAFDPAVGLDTSISGVELPPPELRKVAHIPPTSSQHPFEIRCCVNVPKRRGSRCLQRRGVTQDHALNFSMCRCVCGRNSIRTRCVRALVYPCIKKVAHWLSLLRNSTRRFQLFNRPSLSALFWTRNNWV